MLKSNYFKSLVVILVMVVIMAIFAPKIAKAITVGVVINPTNYQQCVDTCLAYNGYDSYTYSFCQNACYPDPTVVVVGPVWVGGRYYPHGFGHFVPHHDRPYYPRR